MPRRKNLIRFLQTRLGFNTNTKSIKRRRPIAPLMIAGIALMVAVAFSISVESSSSWLRRALEPEVKSSAPVAQKSGDVAKNTAAATGAVSPYFTLSPASPLAPIVTAMKTDALQVDIDMDTKADPGDTLRYTVVIGATGEDATGVMFTDTVDPNTAFVPGSIMTTPLARPDSYSASGNIRIAVAAPGVLANDSDVDGVGPALNVTAGIFLSAQGGNVNLSADGSFTYNPPAGFEGSDTFSYTLNDGEGPSDSGTVTITVSGMIWFINNNAACPCDGRLTNPFNTIAAFHAINDGVGNHPADNDNIFVYESATDYVGPLTLRAGQKFIGQDATDTLSNISGVIPPAGSDPLPATNSGNATIVNLTGNGITVATNNTIRGYTGGNATTDISGSGIGTLNISDVTLNGTGQALNLSTGTLNGTFGSISSTNSATTGISLTSIAGTLTSGSTTITNSTGIGISVNTSSAALNFANTSSTGSGGTGVSLTTNTGAITFGDLDISPDASQRGLLATDNTQTITATSGTLVTSGAAAVEISRASSTTPLAMVLTSSSTTGGPNGVFLRNTSGSFSVIGDNANTALGGNATGGIISGMTGADGSTAGIGVYAENVQNLSLRRLTINGTNQNFGIRGFSVNNFTLEYSTVNGTNGTAAGLPPPNGAGEGSVYFGNSTTNGMTGVGTVTNCIFAGGRARNFSVINTAGTLNRLTITGSQFGLNQNFIDAGDSLSMESRNPGTILNATVRGSTFTGAPGDLVEFVAQSGTTMDVIFGGAAAGQPNAMSNNHPLNNVGGGGMTIASAGTLTFNVSNNTMRDANGSAVTMQLAAPLAGSNEFRSLSGTFNSNTIGAAGVVHSGSKTGNGVFFSFADNATAPKSLATVAITNNIIRNYTGNAAIFADNTGGSYDVNAIISNNTAAEPGPGAFAGLALAAGAPASADDIDVCASILNNNFSAGDPANANDIIVGGGASGASSIRLPGLVPAGTELQRQTQVQAFILANNNVAGTVVSAFVDAPATFASTFIGGAACTTPTTGPITESFTSSNATSESLTAEAPAASSNDNKNDDNVMWAARGENIGQQNVAKLTQAEVSAMVQAAIARWSEAGLSAKSLAKLQALTFEIADLPAGQLATATSSKITLDETAAGHGWFFDVTPSDDNEFGVLVENQELQATESSAAYGRVDLLTVLMRQLGSTVRSGKAKLHGPEAWLLESTLEPGTRRAPAFKKSDSAKASAPKGSKAVVASNKASVAEQPNYQQVASSNKPRNSRGSLRRHHAVVAQPPTSMADVMLNIGVLPAGKSITIKFDVTVDDPFLGTMAQVSNQGTVSGTNFADVLTDDPDVGGAADPTVTPIDLQADLEVTKTDSPDPVIAGNNITYTINFKNNGPNASGATVTDATPAGTTFVSAQVTTGTGWGIVNPGVGNTGNVVFSKATVADEETAVFEIVVKVASSVPAATIITNNATAATTGATDPVPGNNTGTATTTVIAQADLSITKTDGATTEIPGTSVTYTITVSNAGPSDANGVSVADTFPGILTGVTFTSVAAGGATGNTANGAGNIGDTVNMPAGSSITYTVNATIASSATGELTNTATVTAPSGVTDPNEANNSATDTDTLTPQADLSITKDDGATEEVPGTSVTYTIVATNNGPSDANGVSVADTFPGILSGVTFTSVAAGGATGNTANGSGNINDTLNMPAGGSVTYTVTATIDADATGELSNTATVTAPEGVEDTNLANNSATDTDTLTPQADLSITKTDGATDEVPGTSISYTITVSNAGPSDAPGVSVMDTFPAILQGVTYTSVAAGGATGNTAGPANGNINDTVNMPAGSSVTYTVNATIASSATGNLSNTATVTAPGGVSDPTPGNNSATDTDTLTPSADVAVDKSGPATVTPGNNITYTISVTNGGPSDAVNLSLVDAVPVGTTFVSVTTPAGWTRTDLVSPGGTGTITFTAASLVAGAPASVFTLIVNANLGLADGTIIENTVTVASATADPVAGNNSDTVQTTVQNNADLSISKAVAPTGPNAAGSSVTYTVLVTNNGPSPANSVTFTDVVPAGLTVTSQTNPAGWACNSVVGSNGTITCTKAGMADDETATLTVVATIGCNVPNNTVISNTATVGAASPADSNSANNTSTAMFTVTNSAPTVTASVTTSQLPQNSHDLLNVGLAASADDGPCGTPTITVQVFGDENDETPTANNEVFSPDAKDIAAGTLRLRAERVNSGDGRVYLIVVKATDAAGQTGFATVTVVVSKSNSPANVASVNAQAAAAKAFADANNGAPPAGYFVIGDGPIIGNKQ